MKTIDPDIENMFHRMLTQQTTIEQFENWVYENKDLEIDNPDLYLTLISLDYHEPKVFNTLHDTLRDYVYFYRFEAQSIIDTLQSIIDKHLSYFTSILSIYEDYCDGYTFLQKIGLKYGLCLVDYRETNKQANAILASFYPSIIQDCEIVIQWLNDGEIVFLNKQNEFGGFEFQDFRTEEEKVLSQF